MNGSLPRQPLRPLAPAPPGSRHAVRFRQAGATVLLSTDIPAAAEHARAALYAYEAGTGGEARWSITVTADKAAAGSPAPDRAAPVEIGPGLSAACYQSGQARVFRIQEHGMTITLHQARRMIGVRCATEDAAVHFTPRLVRQVMTAQLLAAGAAYAHAAAVTAGGRGILISGHRHQGKTTTMTALLRHLSADFVANDRLLLTLAGGTLRGHAWPAPIRAGIGTLLAYPDLEDLVPAEYRALDQASRWRESAKVRIEPAGFARLIRDGEVSGACPVDVMIWPGIAPRNQGATAEHVEPGEVRSRLLATRLFMTDPATGDTSHVNHWLAAEPPPGQQAANLAGIADAVARSVPCYRVRAGGDPAELARAVAEVIPR